MEKATSRGKIPRTEWAAIAARHATGESFASIARDYRCTAPAIRYIVRQEAASTEERRQDITGEKSTSDVPHSRELEPLVGLVSGFGAKLRDAMTVEISAFLVALDDVSIRATSEAYDRLREATDRLLRAAARVRIELEEAPGPQRSSQSGANGRRERRGAASGSRR